jgi:hypothetical protein
MLALASFALAALVSTAVEIWPQRTAYNMIADGRVGAVEIGAHRVAVPESEVHRFLNNPCSTPHPCRAGPRTSKTRETETA